MDNWLAITETGAEWRFTHGILHVKSSRGGEYVFKPWVMKTIDRDSLPKGTTVREAINSGVDSFTPVIGQAIYAGGRDEWRLSTLVVSLEEIVLEDA